MSVHRKIYIWMQEAYTYTPTCLFKLYIYIHMKLYILYGIFLKGLIEIQFPNMSSYTSALNTAWIRKEVASLINAYRWIVDGGTTCACNALYMYTHLQIHIHIYIYIHRLYMWVLSRWAGNASPHCWTAACVAWQICSLHGWCFWCHLCRGQGVALHSCTIEQWEAGQF